MECGLSDVDLMDNDELDVGAVANEGRRGSVIPD